MKIKRYVIFLFLIGFGCEIVFAYPNDDGQGTVSGVTGSAGGTCAASTCTSCHGGGAYTESFSISSGSGVSVIPRNTIRSFTLSGSGTGSQSPEAGFNLRAYNGANIGTFTAGTGSAVTSSTLRHTASSVTKSWVFSWTSPTSSENVDFCYCVNRVDGDGDGLGGGTGGDIPFCGIQTITVNEPPAAVNDAIALSEDSSTSFNVITFGVNDSDTEGDALSVSSYSGTGGITGLSCSTGSSPSCTINSSSYDSLDTDEPSSVQNFTYILSDGDQTDTGSVQITINGVNDVPVANNDTIAVSIAGTATILVGGATSVLTNDIDLDSNEAVNQANLVSGVSNGILTLNLDGTFSYSHDGSGTLSDSFTYRVWDGDAFSATNATVAITVANTAPTANPDAVVVAEGNSVNFTVLGNDTDPETTVPISVVNITNQTNGTAVVLGNQSITFTHDSSETNTASFMYQANDGFITSANSALVTLSVTPVNDPPVLSAISNQAITENILFALDAGALLTDPDDNNNGVDITWDFQSGQQTGMTISNLGVISWTPPQTGTFNQAYGPVVVRATDGEPLSGASPFNILVSPPDGDLDNVADYDDLCLTVADSINADNDGDGTPGSDGGTNDGGDVCDLDDDNDGIPDAFETANGLNPLDAADAALDTDGDGINNLDEFLAGSNLNFASLTIDSTGYLTPFTLTQPVPTVVAAGATAVGTNDNGPYRPGHFDITWTASNSSDASLGTSIQSLDVRPIVSFVPDQQIEEGSAVNVVATLNGSAATYPVTVNYTVSGTAGASDHNADSGSFVITTPNQMVSIPFSVVADALTEGTETVIFTMTSATNAVIGSDSSHTVSIVEGNIVPVVSLQIRQSGNNVSTAYVSGGTVTVNAIIVDVNVTQTHTFDWSMTSNSLSPPTDTTSSSWTFTPVTGNYLIDVNSTDTGSPALSNRDSQVLSIAAVAPTLTATDTDGDGTNDNDPTEGLNDSDQDGIPDYLDAHSTGVTDQHLIPNQTAAIDNSTWFLVQTEPGLKLVTGNTAKASGNNGVIVTDVNIASFGSTAGGAPLNATDSFEHIGGIYDFELSGLIPGQSANIVIPLQSAIPLNAVFRKFNPETGWGSYVVDSNNRISSAPGMLGACPEPGSSEYVASLVALSNCLQLTIQDGGANDVDGVANGVVKDPGSLGIALQEPVSPTVKGSGRIDLMVFLGLLLLIGFRVFSRTRIRR